jgi:hypothetical protein
MNNSNLSNAFTQLPLTNSANEYTRNIYRSYKRFHPPRAKLDRLTISFTNQDGTDADFKDHYMRFEIRCMPFRIDRIDRSDNNTHELIVRALRKMNLRLKSLGTREYLDKVTVDADEDTNNKTGGADKFVSPNEAEPFDRSPHNSARNKVAVGLGAAAAIAATGYAAHRYGLLSKLTKLTPFGQIPYS